MDAHPAGDKEGRAMNRSEALSRLPFELAYLALLTSYRIKPLSRWEMPLSPESIETLDSLGLEVAGIERYTVFGRRLRRAVLSTRPRYIAAYRKRFAGKRLRSSPRVIRLEGWFFGYPSCCVRHFIEKPYESNGLRSEDQSILFHWACPDCASTTSLLGEYRRIYEECVRIVGQGPSVSLLPGRSPLSPSHSVFQKAIPWAASIAALSLLHGAAWGDPHILPAPDDSDGDGLSYAEERVLGLCPSLTDVDANGIPDGIDESARLLSLFMALPTSPVPDAPYAIEMAMDGLEQCAVCGEWVNMGHYIVVHPLRGLEVQVPVIGLHYLEHGCIGYDGDYHGAGRVDVDGLKRILFPANPAHYMDRYLVSDTDTDLLADEEEPLLETDSSDPDTDDDSLGDAPQIAEDLLAAISSLPRAFRPDGPYIIEHDERGLETCALCGEVMNMGGIEIVNPLEGLSVGLPNIALHYLAHGSLGAGGDVHPNANMLPTVMDVMLNGTGGAHRVPVAGDGDSDGLTDDEELALGLQPDNPDGDLDGRPDGPDLAMFLHDYIESLPVYQLGEPTPEDQIYVRPYFMYGSYDCLTCGEVINMGYIMITDPVAEKSVTLDYYDLHFMKHGSFSTDRPELYGRVDIETLVDVLGVAITDGVVPTPGGAILSNAPNPFTGSTKISFFLPSTRNVSVSIFDAAGRKVCELFSGEAAQGANEFNWDGRDATGRELSSGIYFCKIDFGSMSISRKILKVR
jgi:hypothetical protein